ncbi:MAG TPA: hypothetical protein PKO06_18670 [Candidatus Ozemobacteraceae bacterium]|nr:hypothetical protein [Candidatus Ozemobacteraceae bacterium]
MTISSAGVELLTPGCLGTCWYGKYHYLEPWVGCEHDCDYCYARFRTPVIEAVTARGTSFSRPALTLPLADLQVQLAAELVRQQVEIVKISRFTDFFSASTLAQGWARAVLEVLVASPVRRVIITTKGAPDAACQEIMSRNPDRFSFNVVAKPAASLGFEERIPSLDARLDAACRLQRAGVLTTIHMDPLIPGFEDQSPMLEEFVDRLAAQGLKRVMFSLLLLNDSMIALMRERRGATVTDRILEQFEPPSTRPYLPGQEETVYRQPKPEVRASCIHRVSQVLSERGFAFVLCSLKSGRGQEGAAAGCPLCDGKFYA